MCLMTFCGWREKVEPVVKYLVNGNEQRFALQGVVSKKHPSVGGKRYVAQGSHRASCCSTDDKRQMRLKGCKVVAE